MKSMAYVCQYCKEVYIVYNKYSYRGKFCSMKCASAARKQQKINDWLVGKHKGWTGQTAQLSPFVRDYLINTRGTSCSKCGWNKCHPDDGRPLVEINHIDGDAHNCRPENLEILCPNCHSMTSNHRARNKKSKRKRS